MIHYPQKTNSGQNVQYWTHESYLDKNRVANYHKSLSSQFRFNGITGVFAAVLGSNWIYKTGKTPLAKLPWYITAAVFFGVTTTPGYLLYRYNERKQWQNILKQTTLPLWRQKARVVNLDRAFFFLDDTRNNEVNILHHGLTPERAKNLYPDLILGNIPNKPQKPVSSHHH